MAQSGSASALGAEGRRFKSCCPDHLNILRMCIRWHPAQGYTQGYTFGSHPPFSEPHPPCGPTGRWRTMLPMSSPAYVIDGHRVELVQSADGDRWVCDCAEY